jgi:signal transduction histidine kinase
MPHLAASPSSAASPTAGRRRPFHARDVAVQERRRAERLALLARVGRLVTADLHLDDVLQRASDAIHELLGYDNVAVATLDRASPGSTAPDTLSLRHFGGAYKRAIGGEHRIPVTLGLMGAAARTRAVVLVNDTAGDPRYLPTPGTRGSHAELALPLLVAGDVVGVLNVERRAPFDADDVAHLGIVADQLAVAIENARLHAAARRAAALEERQRLARELHDSVTQQLFTATLVAQGVTAALAREPADAAEAGRRAATLVDVTRGALAEMRALLAELRPCEPGASCAPPTPDPGRERLCAEGLAAAIAAHAASHVAPHLAPDQAPDGSPADALPVSVDAAGYRPQPAACEEALYRIAREALHNVVKHARATRVGVHLTVDDGPVAVARLVVRDDGVGLLPAVRAGRTRRAGAGLGLASMRERATELGGTVAFCSAPGAGTTLTVTIPCSGTAPVEERS